jgi:hypothetical protein
MAKTLEQYKKDFAAWNNAIRLARESNESYQSNRDQFRLMMLEGSKEIGLRVQELRKAGRTGKTVADFKNDAEVSQMLRAYEGYCANLERDLQELTTAKTKLSTDLQKLQSGLASEIKTRSKAFTTKHLDANKSLPALKQLADDVQDAADKKENKLFLTKKLASLADFRKIVDGFIAVELAKGAKEAGGDQQEMLDLQKFNDKVLRRNAMQTRKNRDDALAAGEQARAAVITRDAAQLKAAKVTVAQLAKTVADMVADYDRALKNKWVSDAVDVASNKAALMKDLDAIRKYNRQAQAEAIEVKQLKIATP